MPDESETEQDASGTLNSINWQEEIVLVVVSAILGGLVFSAVSPFIVPWIHDKQVRVFGVQNPTVGIEVEYTEEVEGSRFSVPRNETYDRYTVTVQNPSHKQVNTLTVGLVFPGVIEAQRMGLSQPVDGISYSKNAWIVATDPPDNAAYASNAMKVDELPPLKEVSATFLIDRTPEQAPMPGYWETNGLTEYNASRGTIMISGQYRWQFKGSIYTEIREYTLVNASQPESINRYDICVGDREVEKCAR